MNRGSATHGHLKLPIADRFNEAPIHESGKSADEFNQYPLGKKLQ